MFVEVAGGTGDGDLVVEPRRGQRKLSEIRGVLSRVATNGVVRSWVVAIIFIKATKHL